MAIEGIISVGDLAIITGSWDTFKSTLAVEMGWSMATGKPFLGRFPVLTQMRVGMLQAEIDPGSYDHRVLAFPPTDNFIIASDLASPRHFTFAHLDELEHEIKEWAMDCIILDPIGQMWPRDGSFSPNLGMDISPIMWRLKTLPATVIMVHHDPKPSQGQINRASGSASLLNDPDTRIFIDRDRHTPDITISTRNRLQASVPPFLAHFENGRLLAVNQP